MNAFAPNRIVSANTFRMIAAFQLGVFLLIWLNSPFAILPKPWEVASALHRLWFEEGLSRELFTSILLNVKALAISTVLSVGLAYLTVMPFFRPLVGALTKARFLSLAGFTLLFELIVGGGEPLKLSLLVFSISVFYLTSMAAVVAAIPKSDFDHARTLRMGEWRVVWEVVVLGTLDQVFEVMRQNAAMGWMMLTMVEGLVRSGGGIGVMLLNGSKQFHIDEVFAIQILIMLVGMLQDYIIGATRKVVCPYADLSLERG